jgi:hypothetical protein
VCGERKKGTSGQIGRQSLQKKTSTKMFIDKQKGRERERLNRTAAAEEKKKNSK